MTRFDGTLAGWKLRIQKLIRIGQLISYTEMENSFSWMGFMLNINMCERVWWNMKLFTKAM